MATVPPFEFTNKDDIPKLASSVRASFARGVTKPLAYRLKQLRSLYWA